MSFVGGPLSAKTLSNLRHNGKVWVRPPRIRPPWLILTHAATAERASLSFYATSKGEALFRLFPSYTTAIRCEGPGCVTPSPPGPTNLLLSFSLRDKTQLRHSDTASKWHASKPSLNRLIRPGQIVPAGRKNKLFHKK